MSETEQSRDLPEVLLDRASTLVVHKPAGVSTQMRVDDDGVSIIERIRRNGHPGAELPHRLDRMTGGLLVTATDQDALRFHNQSIRDGLWTKIYVARVRRPTHAFKLLGKKKVYLRRKGRRANVVKSGGKVARLEVLALADVPGCHDMADVVVDLETGRFHQIRATLASCSAPIIGDATYGDETPALPLLTHVMMRLPLPDGSWQLVRTNPFPDDVEVDGELPGFIDALQEELAPPRSSSDPA